MEENENIHSNIKRLRTILLLLFFEASRRQGVVYEVFHKFHDTLNNNGIILTQIILH